MCKNIFAVLLAVGAGVLAVATPADAWTRPPRHPHKVIVRHPAPNWALRQRILKHGGTINLNGGSTINSKQPFGFN